MGDDNTKAQGKTLSNVIRIGDERIHDHLGKIVRGSVEETLNALLDAEADRLCSAERYERSEARRDTRAGSYDRKLQTRAGEVSLKVPKLRRQTPASAGASSSRRRSSNATGAGNARSRRPWSRCTWPVSRSDGSRTSPRPCGARA